MSEVDLLPSTPNPNYVAIVAAAVRGLIQFLSGLGFLGGVYSDSQITMAATAIVFVGTLIWSTWQKLQAEKKRHDAAVESACQSAAASAAAGAPVAIAVAPPPNKARLP